MYEVIFTGKTEKRLNKIPVVWRERILLSLGKLTKDPFIGKKLEGRYKNDYSIRVWPYRIIYTIKKKELIVEVIEIAQRGGAYRK